MSTEAATVETTTSEVTTEPAGGGNEAATQIATDAPVEGKEAGAVAAEVAKYAANAKYNVFGREKEFDPALHSLITSKEIEDKIRDLYTKADGTDYLKDSREKAVEKNRGYEGQIDRFNKQIEELDFFVKSGDLTSFFEKTQIPFNQIYSWCRQQLDYAEQPQLKSQDDQRRMQNIQQYQQSLQNNEAQTYYEQAANQLRERETEFVLRQPDIAPMVEMFNSRAGRPGAFRDELIDRGRMHFQSRGVDVPVDQLVQEVVTLYGLRQTQTPQMTGTNVGPSNGVVQGSRNKPVLPSIPGSGQSAVKKENGRGIAGLKQRRAEIMAQNGE